MKAPAAGALCAEAADRTPFPTSSCAPVNYSSGMFKFQRYQERARGRCRENFAKVRRAQFYAKAPTVCVFRHCNKLALCLGTVKCGLSEHTHTASVTLLVCRRDFHFCIPDGTVCCRPSWNINWDGRRVTEFAAASWQKAPRPLAHSGLSIFA